MSEQNIGGFFDIDDDSIVTLTDENGNDIDFIILDVVSHEGNDYLVLFPLDVDENDEAFDDDAVLILLATRTEDGEVYENVEDEALLNAVYAKFVEQNPPSADENEEGFVNG